MMHLLAA